MFSKKYQVYFVLFHGGKGNKLPNNHFISTELRLTHVFVLLYFTVALTRYVLHVSTVISACVGLSSHLGRTAAGAGSSAGAADLRRRIRSAGRGRPTN